MSEKGRRGAPARASVEAIAMPERRHSSTPAPRPRGGIAMSERYRLGAPAGASAEAIAMSEHCRPNAPSPRSGEGDPHV